MSYSDDYKKAMEKVSASESWKASTLQKMQQVQQSPSRRDWLPQFCFPRMAVPALCAAVLWFCNASYPESAVSGCNPVRCALFGKQCRA